jgi:hypothetical protein
MADADQIDFTFTWRALELLGKGLYSNPWSAISELVANGFDAGASEVLVHIDLRNKKHATVEIIDNGSGMDREAVQVYAQVGHDKRAASAAGEAATDTSYMGRKGIGKLAALYLSSFVTISTRTEGSDSRWVLDARTETRGGADDYPHLIEGFTEPQTPCIEVWDSTVRGTRIHLSDVDLTRMGERTVVALKQLLANQFITGGGTHRSIKVWVQQTDLASGDDPLAQFNEAKRQVAFKNMAFLEYNFSADHPDPEGLADADYWVTFPPKERGRVAHARKVETKRFDAKPHTEMLWANHHETLNSELHTYKGRPYVLTGWVGIHATIRSDEAEKNDDRFIRNGTYNPAQIRLYVRGKLASDRLLTQLGLTRQYLNYIEGELSFDLLDDDQLDDIATASRQDFDETDDRVALLRAMVRPIVQRLISARQRLVVENEAADQKSDADARARAKGVFADQIAEDLAGFDDVPESTRDEFQLLALNKIQGDIEIKQDFIVFLSHSSTDRAFVNFLYELLLSKGARPEEIFYTSRPNDASGYAVLESLQHQIKSTIRAKNTLLFYLTSANFMQSQYCMFEGGAGWITRSVGEYALLSMRFKDVPAFLTNGKMEMSIVADSAIELRADLHQYLIQIVLNPMIDHLNRGRSIKAMPLIERFPSIDFPSKVALIAEGNTESAYFDSDIVSHWAAHIDPVAADYVADMIQREERAHGGL